MNDTLSQKETEYQAKIADMEFDAKLSELLKQSGVKNVKAAKALLDLDTLKKSKNQEADVADAIKKLSEAEDSSMLFGESVVKGGVDTAGSVSKPSGGLSAVEQAFYDKNPDLRPTTD